MKFLQNFPNCVIQTFPDNKDCKDYAKVFFEYNEQELKAFNERGNGVYFSPNGFKEARKKENLTNLNAVYADLDLAKEGQEVDIKTLKIKLWQELLSHVPPSFIIDTKNGLQPIWLIEADVSQTELHKKVIKGIIEWSKQFGCAGDAVHDCTRVLRLPNFNHCKGEPYLCRAKKTSEYVYTLEDLEKYFPYTEPEAIKQNTHENGELDSPLVQAINQIDFETLIISAFGYIGRIAEFDNQGRLILDGRLTGTFKGKTGGEFLASSSHEPFKGNRVTAVADILGVTNKEAFKWIKETFSLNPVDEVKKAKALTKLKETPKPKKERGYYSWGTPQLTKFFAPIKSNTYAIVGGGFGVGKTPFCVNLALANAELGHKVLYLSLEMENEEIFDHLARRVAGITVEEETVSSIPSRKKEVYEKELDKVQNIPNMTFKGIPGGVEVTWDIAQELMKGDWDLIILDNFNLIVKKEGVSTFEHEGWLSSQLLGYTSQHQTPLIVVHHYSKGGARETAKTGYSLGGNSKIMNDAHRIVLLERKRFSIDEEPSQIEKAELRVTLDKARSYDRENGLIYFYKGRFFDEYPQTNPDQQIWDNLLYN
jgi:hypothetical protein